MLTRKFTRLLTTVLSIALAASLFALPAAAKGKKGKAASARSKAGGKQARGGKSSRRELARRGKRGRNRIVRDDAGKNEFVGNHPIVPDNVEVIEHGSANPTEIARLLNPPAPSSQTNAAFDASATSSVVRNRKVNIDSERVIQIQQALAKRGLYTGETTGVYDETTVDAMRRFQTSNKIAVTGYPTAHSLKRLGLGSW